jgi:VWFA-related protein
MQAMRTRGAAAALALVLAGAGPRAAAAQTTRQLWVGVFNGRHQPVTDLTPEDFMLTEDNAPRKITRASLAEDPMRIVLLVDNGDATQQIITHIREGLHTFIDALQPEHEVVLITTGRQLRVREKETTDHATLHKDVDQIFPDKGSATVLLDSLRESWDRFLKKAPDRWPVFVIVTTDGTEGSNATQQQQYDQFLSALLGANGSVHAVAMQVRGGTGSLASQVALNLTQNTAGEYLPIAASTGLANALKRVAGRLSTDYDYIRTRYQIQYESRARNAADAQIGLSVLGDDDVTLQMAPDRRRQ